MGWNDGKLEKDLVISVISVTGLKNNFKIHFILFWQRESWNFPYVETSPPEKDIISKSYSHHIFMQSWKVLSGLNYSYWSKIKLSGFTTKCSNV